MTWKKPPAELELKERYAEAAVLYFSSDQRFVLLYGTIIQGPKSEEVSQGDGQVVFLGTWKLTGDSLHVQYRLVSRTVAKKGETLPGPVQSEDVQVRGSTLLFQKNLFKRDEKLDHDLKATLQGESARQGISKPWKPSQPASAWSVGHPGSGGPPGRPAIRIPSEFPDTEYYRSTSKISFEM